MIAPGEIIIKDPGILVGLMERNYAPLLTQIIKYVAKEYGLVMTESYRPKKHMNDLHGTQPVRAIDARTWLYSNDTLRKLETDVNSSWVYDPERPQKKVFYVHDSGQGQHAHIQTHPNTRRRSVV